VFGIFYSNSIVMLLFVSNKSLVSSAILITTFYSGKILTLGFLYESKIKKKYGG